MEEEELQHSSESIKHLIFREEEPEKSFPRYVSKFSSQVRQEGSKNKLCHRTMGLPADFFISYPCEFLRKRARKVQRPDITKCDPKHQANQSRVPRHDDWKREKRAEKVAKNYVRENVAKVSNAVPKTGPSRYMDQATGQRYHDCVLAAPVFSHGKLFGKVPRYIKERKKNEKERMEMLRKEREKAREASTLRELPQEERQQLLDGLKRRWAEMQGEFQLLPMLNDTAPQIKRKLRLEKDLAALEREIDHIERNQLIFVVDPSMGYCVQKPLQS